MAGTDCHVSDASLPSLPFLQQEQSSEASSTSDEEAEEPRGSASTQPSGAQPPHKGDLTAAAPPPYQAAVSYPTATPQPQPPAYSEKPGAYPHPDTSAAYPPQPSAPPLGPDQQGYPPATVLPYPVLSHDAAYPPPPVTGMSGRA